MVQAKSALISTQHLKLSKDGQRLMRRLIVSNCSNELSTFVLVILSYPLYTFLVVLVYRLICTA